MLLPKTLTFISTAAALLFTTAVADDPQKPLDESRYIGEPMCLNPAKHDSGLDNHNACQDAIDAVARQQDGIKSDKGNCKELSRSGNCIVALCNPTNTQATLDPKIVAAVAQGIHAYCKVGPADDRWTGGSTFTYGLQPWGEERLGVTVYLGQFYARPAPELGSCGPPKCQNKRALAAKRALENLSPRTPMSPSLLSRAPLTKPLSPRAVGDTIDVAGGWRIRLTSRGQWQANSATAGHMTAVGSQLVQNWNTARDGGGGNTVTAHAEPNPDYRLAMQIQAANNRQVDQVPGAFRDGIRSAFRQMWINEGRPGTMEAAIERVTALNEEPFSFVELYAHITFLEARITREDGNRFQMEVVYAPEGVRYGSFDRIN